MDKKTRRFLLGPAALIFLAGTLWVCGPRQPSYEVTFFLTSDLHYGVSPTVAAANATTVDAMNALPGGTWPAGPGGGSIGVPRGVAVLGDLLEDGADPKAPEWWKEFAADYGVNGEGRLKYPAYENAGNHDGGEDETVRRGIRERNKVRPGLKSVSPNGINYSWDWGEIHFVSLGLFTGSAGEDIVNQWGTHFTGSWRLPGYSLEFLKDDLARNVGRSGRPVVLLQHYGWDRWGLGWWSENERRQMAEALQAYNVIAIFWGHTHEFQSMNWEGIPTWCVGSGQRDPAPGEFVVVRIRPDGMDVAERKVGDGAWGGWTRVLFNGKR